MKTKACSFCILILLFVATVTLSGCDTATRLDRTVEITDMVGRTVQIPEEPRRIAILDPFAGYAAILLDQGDKIVATVGGVKRDLLLQAISPSLADAEVVKEEGSVNAEAVLRLDADLIIIKGDDYAAKNERDKLDRMRIPYLVVEYRSMAEQQEAVHLMGQALGQAEKAQSYIAYYRETVNRVASMTATIPDERKPALYHAIAAAIRTDAIDSIGAEWIAVTGARNVALDAALPVGEKEYATTIEEIYIWDPDLIICNESGVNEYILLSGQWQGLRAVREGKVYQIPIGVSRMGHFNSIEVPLAIWWLADLLYPDLVPDFRFRDELKRFYSDFFNYELDEDTIDKILSGKDIRAPGQLN